MSTSVRTHPWWVAGLAAAAAVATVVVLALLGSFDADPAPSKPIPVVVVKTSGGIDEANAQRQERLLQHGVAVKQVQATGDTKGDVHAGTPAVGQELAYEAGTAAGAGK
jgi:hypothetical protein